MHELAEERSLAMHRAVATMLAADVTLVEEARRRVEGWLADKSVHPRYAEAWHDLLAGPVERLLEVHVDPCEKARALRQCSLFAGVLEPRERWRIWRETRQRWEQGAS